MIGAVAEYRLCYLLRLVELPQCTDVQDSERLSDLCMVTWLIQSRVGTRTQPTVSTLNCTVSFHRATQAEVFIECNLSLLGYLIHPVELFGRELGICMLKLEYLDRACCHSRFLGTS